MDVKKKPNVHLDGHELYLNTLTGNWAFRPIKGYSTKYLRKDTFIPNETSKKIYANKTNGKNANGKNASLGKARNAKNDEYYTRLEDITVELQHYKPYFKDKVVYCPCDKMYNLGRSNFAKYFLGKFHSLGIKKLICTQYNPNGFGVSTIYDFEKIEKLGIKWEYNGEKEDGEFVDESEIDTFFLKGNGSFDSPECREIMKNCDIVVTNPPFSLFRKFLSQIMEFNKKFIIIGDEGVVKYKEVFPLIQQNKIWMGYGKPKAYATTLEKIENDKSQYEEDGVIYQKFGNHCWYTNLEHSKRKNKIYLSKHYDPKLYPIFDNYDAINVKQVKDIPVDYDGVMAVPITYIAKHNPNQFELVGQLNTGCFVDENGWQASNGKNMLSLNGKNVFHRILIRKISNIPSEE
jgi:hypothetical protein